MSDTPLDHGWFQATDGLWYPPELNPSPSQPVWDDDVVDEDAEAEWQREQEAARVAYQDYLEEERNAEAAADLETLRWWDRFMSSIDSGTDRHGCLAFILGTLVVLTVGIGFAFFFVKGSIAWEGARQAVGEGTVVLLLIVIVGGAYLKGRAQGRR